MTFHDFSLDPRLLESLDAMGFRTPTPIQEKAIPVILEGNDLIACAQTGTGKTAAFILPVINRMMDSDHRHLNTLVIAPTRELAVQIDQQIEGFAYFTGVSSIPVYGGTDGTAWDAQKKALESGADIIIATPGRLIALLAGGTIDLTRLQHLILDEADRMLDMGFFDDIVRIISYLPAKRQTLLFSATMPPKIQQLTKKILNNPVEISLAIAKPAAGISQQVYLTFDEQKLPLLQHILKSKEWNSVIIFSSRKETVKKLDQVFRRANILAHAFHSDLEQSEREIMLRAFKNKQVNIIIGTDVLSRGIDVEGISLVLNWDVPPDAEDYVHRIGRTARADTTGTAITFVNERDMRQFAMIEKLIESRIPQLPLPASLGAGPEFRSERHAHKPTPHNNNSNNKGGKRPFNFKRKPRA